MFKQRAISAVILVIIAAITLYFGGALTCLVMCAVSLIGVMELLRIYGLNKKGLGYAAYGASVYITADRGLYAGHPCNLCAHISELQR